MSVHSNTTEWREIFYLESEVIIIEVSIVDDCRIEFVLKHTLSFLIKFMLIEPHEERC